MRIYAKRQPMIKYRFKDSMGCVFFKQFRSDHEARLWFEQHKAHYCLREFGSLGQVYPVQSSGLYLR